MVVKFLNQNFHYSENRKKIVEVRFECIGIGELDTINETFQAELIIRSTWNSPINDLNDSNAYDPKKDWNPNLSIENAVVIKSENITYKLEKSSDSLDNFRITEVRRVKGVFWERYQLSNFPLDTQELNVVLTSKYGENLVSLVVHPTEASFINFEAVHVFRDQQKWHLFRLVDVVEYEKTHKKTDEKLSFRRKNSVFSLNKNLTEIVEKTKNIKPPKLAVRFHAARRPGHIMYNAFFLICVVMLMCLPPFAIDIRIIDKRLVCHLTILLALVTLKWVMNRSLPDTSSVTILDKYTITSIVFNCCVMVWHAIGHVYVTNGYPPTPEKDIGKTLDTSFLLIFSGSYVIIQLVFGYILLQAYSVVRNLYKREAEYTENYKDVFTSNTYIDDE